MRSRKSIFMVLALVLAICLGPAWALEKIPAKSGPTTDAVPEGVSNLYFTTTRVNNIINAWAGSSTITTLGTITTGVWHGSAISHTYLTGIAQADVAGLTTTSTPTFAGVSITTLAAAVTNGAAGTFTATAGNASTVSNTAVTANTLVVGLVATNAAGATLLAGGYYQSAVSATHSFTITFTLAAAGTETINYLMVN